MSTGVGDMGIRKDLRLSPFKISNFEHIFQTLACIVLVLDERGTIRFINDNGSRLLEYETSELIGQDWFFRCLDESIREERQIFFDNTIRRFSGNVQLSNQMQADIPNPNLMTTPISHENAVVTKSGNSRIMLWRNHPFYHMNGNFEGVLCIGEDITEKKRLEDLLVAREKLREFSVHHSLEELIQFLLEQAEKLTRSKSGYICILEASKESLGVKTGSSILVKPEKGTLEEGKSPVTFDGEIANCVRSAKPIIQNDRLVMNQGEVILEKDSPLMRQMMIPVLKGDSVTAVIALANKPVRYTEQDVEVVNQLSSLAWDIIGRKQAERALEEINLELQQALSREQLLANTDELTGLNNRRRIVEIATHEIMMAKRYYQPLSVLMFDLDHLKSVNDTYGHSEGDAVIKRIAKVAAGELRASDAIGRLGGDEFIVLLPMAHVDQARQVAERIRSKVLSCISNGDSKLLKVSISVGVSEYRPDDKDEITADLLFCQADRAMYCAKSQGRNVVVINESHEKPNHDHVTDCTTDNAEYILSFPKMEDYDSEDAYTLGNT